MGHCALLLWGCVALSPRRLSCRGFKTSFPQKPPVDRPHEWASSCASSRERFSSSTSPVRAWRAGWSGPARAPIAVRPAVALASQRALRRPASHRCGTHPRLASKQAPRPKANGRTAPTGAYGARSNRAFDCRPRAIRERFADGARVQVEEVADGYDQRCLACCASSSRAACRHRASRQQPANGRGPWCARRPPHTLPSTASVPPHEIKICNVSKSFS